jgi:hypothetical protein
LVSHEPIEIEFSGKWFPVSHEPIEIEFFGKWFPIGNSRREYESGLHLSENLPKLTNQMKGPQN